ncbi:class I SAM-dependent methyltransferase [Methanotorris formicicus]|uniref:Methyltransferase type 11 n=1 Tax=Methanotorris formicicus Mc-S-70 TaxID=647171 RepID=H1KWV7_9EURY|nr:class I SAM-dependent methyltransferase [Methanotorris formicicus]EHP89090.1 Methyltransferase type 11 [Methanotorris formicicus Mc-S-70]
MKDDYKDFDEIVRNIFAPIYPVIAKQIVERTNIKDGICIDLGTGTGALARGIAKITNLKVYALDISEDMLKLTEKYTKEEKLDGKIIPILGDVHNMPFKDNFADLIISRGSMFFWEDKVKAFKEIYRVLKPEGMAHIGGGFGNKELKEKIFAEMRKRNPNWDNEVKSRMGNHNKELLKEILNKAGIPNYKIINNDSGLWILIKKE